MCMLMISLKVGDRIRFAGEQKLYNVMAVNKRFAICTKPMNLYDTVLYTILDNKVGMRGTNNLVFNKYDYSTQADIDRCLKDLQFGSIAVSGRNRVPIEITKFEH